MRKCENCFNGHFNLSDRGEELFCDSNEYLEEYVDPNFVCDEHRFILGMEEEKNYLFYDEALMAPGYIIIHKENDQIDKFIKIYSTSEGGFPSLAIRGYKKGLDQDCKNGYMSFAFRDIEDYENGLYDAFTDLCYKLKDKKICSINRSLHNNNQMFLINNGVVTRVIMIKDFLTAGDYFDLILGDGYTCPNYESFLNLYNELGKHANEQLKDDDIKKLIFRK